MDSTVARRYATAIADATLNGGNLEQVAKELESFAELMKSSEDLRHALLTRAQLDAAEARRS